MADTVPTTTTESTAPRQWGWSLLVVGLAMLAVGSVATPVLADRVGGDTSAGGLIECTSGVVTDGGVSMSALTVTRTPTVLPTSPGDCSKG